MTYALLLPVLLMISSVVSEAQPPEQSGGLLDLYPAGDDYFFEIASLPGLSTNRTRVVALFSLTHNLMTFRAENRGTERYYRATPRLYVEAIDPEGVVAGFGQWSDTVVETVYRNTLSKQERAPGTVVMELRPGRYTFRYAIDQGEPATGFTAETDTILVPDFGRDAAVFGTPIFLDHGVGQASGRSGSMQYVAPLILDGNAPFGRPFTLVVPGTSSDEVFRLDYVVERVDPVSGSGSEVLAGRAERLGAGGTILGDPEMRDRRVVIGLQEGTAASGAWLYRIDAPGGDLAPGDYRLVLRLATESGKFADTTDFRVRWIDRPLSLGDPTYAIRALRPIATDREIDRLLSGDDERRRAALEEFWKESDPTPETVYNEKMAAYYQRVDYAYFNFATFGQTDGAKTDRGKIFILYGHPTDVERRLDPEGGPREVWTYDNVVGRAFVFHDRAESGEYRLVEYYDL